MWVVQLGGQRVRCGAKLMRATKHAGGVGGKCEAVHMGGVLQGRLQYLVRRLPSGRRRWHLRAANLQPETCARMSGTWGMSECMSDMQQTACREHV